MRVIGLVLALLYLHLAPAAAQSQAAAGAKVAEQWLALVDQQQYAASWAQASDEFKKQIPEREWAQAVGGVRDPLGKVSTRKLVMSRETKTLPGLPDGKYVLLQYDTAFANKPNGIETITLVENNGALKVGGYFIK